MSGINAGDAACTTGLSGKIYADWVGDTANNLLTTPAGAAQAAAVKSQAFQWATALKAQLQEEGVFADCWNSVVQTVANNSMTCVNFDQKVTDTDSAVTTGAAWVFTVPANKGGLYLVQSSVALNSSVAGGTALLSVLKNGTNAAAEFHRGMRIANVTAGVQDITVSSTLSLVPGNTVSIGIYQATGSTQQIENPGSAINNWIQITRLVGF